MLALDRALGVVAGLVLYGDHAIADQVYYATTRPRLAKNLVGDSEFTLIRFRPGEASDGGTGLLSFTVDLQPTAVELDQVREWLTDRGMSNVRLSAVPWTAGKVHLVSALSEDDGFVEQLQGSTYPDLIGSGRATLSASLTGDGVDLIESLFDGAGVPPVGVRYELEYEGLQPALNVRVRADYRRVHEAFSLGFEAGVAYQGVGVRAGVDTATRSLIESGAIQIEVVHLTDDQSVRDNVEAAVRWLQEKLVDDFFEDSLQPPAQENLLDKAIETAIALGAATLQEALEDETLVAAMSERLGLPVDSLRALSEQRDDAATTAGESTFALRLQFTLKDIRAEQLKWLTLDWTEAHAQRRTAGPQTLLSGFDRLPAVVTIEERDAFWERVNVNVRPMGDFASLGVDRLLVHLAFPDETGPRGGIDSLVFESGESPPQLFRRWADGLMPRVRVRKEVHFVDAGPWPGAPVFDGPWRTVPVSELAVHPLVDVPRVDLELLLDALDFADTPEVQVMVRVAGVERSSMLIDADSAAPRFRYRPETVTVPVEESGVGNGEGRDDPNRINPRVEVRLRWFLANGATVDGDWEVATGNVHRLTTPWKAARTVRFLPVLPADTEMAIVTVDMMDDGLRRSFEPIQFAGGDRRAQSLEIRSLDEVVPPLDVSIFALRADGSTFTGTPFSTRDPVIVVRDREGNTRIITVRLLAGETLAQHGVLALRVVLLGSDSGDMLDEVIFSESRREPQSFVVSDAGETERLRYQVIRYGLDAIASMSVIAAIPVSGIVVSAAAGE